MSAQTKTVTRAASEIVAAVAMLILLIYIADAIVAMSLGREDSTGFLPMSEAVRGMIFGTASIVLFLVAFGMNVKGRSRTTAILLIAGGAIMGTAVLAASAMAEGGLGAIPGSFLGVIIVGYVIMGLGIWQAVRKGPAVAA
jgi:predicted permease